MEVAVRLARAAAEGAELASDKTDVGEIHVAIDDVGDDIADQFAAQHVGGDQQAEQIVAFGIRQQQTLFAREDAAILRRHDLFERVARFAKDMRDATVGHSSGGKCFAVQNRGRTRVTGSSSDSTSLSETDRSCRRANQVARAAPAGLISEPSNDTCRGAS